MKKTTSVQDYINTNIHFEKALKQLREIIISTELEETIKWNAPTYTLNGKNVIGLGAFKNHFGIWFFNGVFLKDEDNLLVNAQEGKTKALRQMRFTSIEDIDKVKVLDYVLEAIENQKLGKETKPQRASKEIVVPDALKTMLKSDPKLEEAFNQLTPGKQKEYCIHISEAKRETTKLKRLEKIIPLILKQKGLYDKYKTC
ncbi:MAG: YdeI/OmpD-associated family protein [Winogradskyella sp.]